METPRSDSRKEFDDEPSVEVLTAQIVDESERLLNGQSFALKWCTTYVGESGYGSEDSLQSPSKSALTITLERCVAAMYQNGQAVPLSSGDNYAHAFVGFGDISYEPGGTEDRNSGQLHMRLFDDGRLHIRASDKVEEGTHVFEEFECPSTESGQIAEELFELLKSMPPYEESRIFTDPNPMFSWPVIQAAKKLLSYANNADSAEKQYDAVRGQTLAKSMLAAATGENADFTSWMSKKFNRDVADETLTIGVDIMPEVTSALASHYAYMELLGYKRTKWRFTISQQDGTEHRQTELIINIDGTRELLEAKANESQDKWHIRMMLLGPVQLTPARLREFLNILRDPALHVVDDEQQV